MEYAHHLRMKYPNLHITDDLMPVPKHKQFLASLVGYAQMGGFAVAFFGTQIFGAISVPVPHWAQYLQENKGATIGIFFVGNIINSNLISVCIPCLLIHFPSLAKKFCRTLLPRVSDSITDWRIRGVSWRATSSL
jgi:hypothetical protein